VLNIDQRGVGRFRGVVPFSGGGFSTGVLGGGDDFEIPIL
jgi:hypothetical protein